MRLKRLGENQWHVQTSLQLRYTIQGPSNLAELLLPKALGPYTYERRRTPVNMVLEFIKLGIRDKNMC